MVMDEEHDDGLGGRSRTRREVTEANRWGKALFELDPAQFAAAPIPDEVRAEAEVARQARSFRARDRAIARVDALMRDLDEGQVARVDSFLASPPALSAHPDTLRWMARLVEDPDAVRVFVDTFPAVEVQRLRQLVRNLKRPETAVRARTSLIEMLDQLFFGAPEAE